MDAMRMWLIDDPCKLYSFKVWLELNPEYDPRL
jgi:hypothetical protein